MSVEAGGTSAPPPAAAASEPAAPAPAASSAPGDAGASAPGTSGAPAAGDYDWGAWTPDSTDYPDTYKPAVSALTAHYERQLATMRAESETNAFFRDLWSQSEQGTSAEEIAGLLEDRDKLASMKEQYDALNASTTAWTTEKAQLVQDMTALQSRLQEMEARWPEAEASIRSAMETEYAALIQQDVDAFFVRHGQDLEKPEVAEAFTKFHAKDVHDSQAIELAKMPPDDQAFAMALLEGGTPPNNVYGLTLQAARSRTPPVSPAVGLTQGGSPVSRSPSPPQDPPGPRPGAAPRYTGRFARTNAVLSTYGQ